MRGLFQSIEEFFEVTHVIWKGRMCKALRLDHVDSSCRKSCKKALVISSCLMHQLDDTAIESTVRMVVGLTTGLKVSP